MYKLLIVEDEEIFRRVLPEIIDWSSIGFEVAGVAENGRKALSLLEELEVDVILTDIRMPVINGLELAMEVRSRYPAIRVLLLSAFNEFDYARKGIDCGVYGYILKSDGEEEIAEYFARLKGQMDEEKGRSNSAEKPWTKREQLFRALKGSEADFVRMLEAETGRTGILGQGGYLAAVLEVDEYRTVLASSGIDKTNQLLHWISEYLYKGIEMKGNGIVISAEYTFAVLWNTGEKAALQFLPALFRELHEELAVWNPGGEITLTCGMGNVTETVDGLPDSYRLAEEALRHRTYLGGGQIIPGTQLAPKAASTITFGDENKWIREITSLLHEDSSAKMGEYLDRLEQGYREEKVMETGVVSGFCIKLILVALQDIGRMRANTDELLTKSGYLIREIDECTTITCIFKKLKLFLVECIVFLTDDKGVQNRKIIVEAMQYLESNYSRPVSLEDVAKHVNVHPVHLSRLFSKDMGKTFRCVLTEIRMEAAKKLLCDINYKVYEISQLVGYEKPRYFSELFRSMTGLTPLEYREKFGS